MTKPKIVSPEAFAREYIRLEDGRPLIFEDWQYYYIIKPLFYTYDENGRRKYNFVLIMIGKKNGKTIIASFTACYMLLADGEEEPEVYSLANTKEQARLIHRNMVRFIKRSPALSRELKIYKDAIERRDGSGVYRVLSSDAPALHGLNPSCVIVDEVWGFRNWDLFEAVTTSPARRQPLTFCISYSGYEQFEGSPLWDLYQAGEAGTDPRMLYVNFTGDGVGPGTANPASWITPEYLEQQRRRLPEHIYRRLHCNEWTSGSSAFLSREDVGLAITPHLGQKWAGEAKLRFLIATDFGLSKDATVTTTVHFDRGTGKVVLDNIKTWRGSRLRKVRIEDVEAHLLTLNDNFPGARFIFDPWQAVNSMQRLKERGLKIEEFVFSPANIMRLTQNLFSLFKDRRIEIFDYPDLVKELVSVKVVEKGYGFRIDHNSGQHDDHVISLGMAALAAVNQSKKTVRFAFVDDPAPSPWQRFAL